MRKLIAAINLSIDGYCDHTLGIADAELHAHYSDLLRNAGVLLYGRKTYELMTFWQQLLERPSGETALDEFAKTIDSVPKIVFSTTLSAPTWNSASLATLPFEEEIERLKKLPGKDIFLGSPSLIAEATRRKMVDEWQLCVHPVIAGKGLTLFKNLEEVIILKLEKTKVLGSGAIVHYYSK